VKISFKSQNRERSQLFKRLKKIQKLESDGGLCYLFITLVTINDHYAIVHLFHGAKCPSSGLISAAIMSKIEKLILKILRGKSDANISFDDLRNLLLHLGFQERVRGSHHIFVKELV